MLARAISIALPAPLRTWPSEVCVCLTDGKEPVILQAADDYTNAVRFQPTDVGYLLLAQVLEANGTKAARAARNHAERMSCDLSRATQSMKQLLAQ